MDLALSQIRQAAHKWEFAIHAYVFMLDHVHLLVEGLSEASDLKAFASLAKQRAGYADFPGRPRTTVAAKLLRARAAR